MEFKFTDPATDFSLGLKVIERYHQTFLLEGEKLLSLVENLKKQGMNEELANQCIAMHCFYFNANRLHHADEEQGLFPLLANRSRLYDGMIDLLVHDHEDIEELWMPLLQILGDPEKIEDFSEFQTLAIEFEKKHREHLLREDEDFLPKVATLLSLEENKQAGQKMAELRHIASS